MGEQWGDDRGFHYFFIRCDVTLPKQADTPCNLCLAICSGIPGAWEHEPSCSVASWPPAHSPEGTQPGGCPLLHVIFATPVLRISRLYQSFFTCKKPLYYVVIMQAAREAKLCHFWSLHAPYLRAACPSSTLEVISPVLSLPYLTKLAIFSQFRSHFSDSQRPRYYLGKEKLADSQHQSPQLPAHILQSWHGARDGWTVKRRWMDSPQQATACLHLHWAISSYSGCQSTLHRLSPSRKYSPQFQAQHVSSDPCSWQRELSCLYLPLPPVDTLTCCISSLSPQWEERVGCSVCQYLIFMAKHPCSSH